MREEEKQKGRNREREEGDDVQVRGPEEDGVHHDGDDHHLGDLAPAGELGRVDVHLAPAGVHLWYMMVSVLVEGKQHS
jgi:hypothetical protein